MVDVMRLVVGSLALLLAATVPLRAQSIVKSPVTPEDLRPNDPGVPNAFALRGQFERVVVIRIKYKTDLLAGLQQVVKEENIENGVILSGAGSLRGYHVHLVNNRDLPTSNIFINRPDTPADLASMNGYIVRGKVHAHMTIGIGEKTVAGHLEPGTEVFTYAVVTVGVMNGTDLGKVDDKTYR